MFFTITKRASRYLHVLAQNNYHDVRNLCYSSLALWDKVAHVIVLVIL